MLELCVDWDWGLGENNRVACLKGGDRQMLIYNDNLMS